MYEMQGTSPGLAASGQPVTWLSRRGHAARQSQEPALGSGCPAPPTSRSCPRAVPVSNGESISTATARAPARPAPHIFRVSSPVHTLSTGYGWLSAFNSCFPPPYTQVIHRLPGVTRGTLAARRVRRTEFTCFTIQFPALGDAIAEIIWLNSACLSDRSGIAARARPGGPCGSWPAPSGPCDDEDDQLGASSLR